MLVFQTEWLAIFFPRAYRPAFCAAWGKNLPIRFLASGDSLYQLFEAFAFSRRWLWKSFMKLTGHLSVPIANILGLKCYWWAPSMPFLVLLPLSAIQTKTSLPISGSFWNSKSPQHSFQLHILSPENKVKGKKPPQCTLKCFGVVTNKFFTLK